MFRKGKYKNKDKVSKLTPLRLFLLLLFRVAVSFVEELLMKEAEGFFFGESTVKAM